MLDHDNMPYLQGPASAVAALALAGLAVVFVPWALAALTELVAWLHALDPTLARGDGAIA